MGVRPSSVLRPSVRPSVLRPSSVCPKFFFNFYRVSSYSEFQMPCQTAAEQGVAELRILDFKTTWSVLQKPSQTAATRGKAELRILNFKTTWSEFQKPSQIAGSITSKIIF